MPLKEEEEEDEVVCVEEEDVLTALVSVLEAGAVEGSGESERLKAQEQGTPAMAAAIRRINTALGRIFKG